MYVQYSYEYVHIICISLSWSQNDELKKDNLIIIYMIEAQQIWTTDHSLRRAFGTCIQIVYPSPVVLCYVMYVVMYVASLSYVSVICKQVSIKQCAYNLCSQIGWWGAGRGGGFFCKLCRMQNFFFGHQVSYVAHNEKPSLCYIARQLTKLTVDSCAS